MTWDGWKDHLKEAVAEWERKKANHEPGTEPSNESAKAKVIRLKAKGLYEDGVFNKALKDHKSKAARRRGRRDAQRAAVNAAMNPKKYVPPEDKAQAAGERSAFRSQRRAKQQRLRDFAHGY